MAYVTVKTHDVTITGTVYYVGATRSWGYKFSILEEYDAALNKSRLTLSSSKVQFSVNEHVSIYGVIKMGGTTVGNYRGVAATTPGGSSYATFGSGSSIEVAHDEYGAGPSVQIRFAKATGTPDTIGSNFGFSPTNGVVVGFSTSTTRNIQVTSHARASTVSVPASVDTQSALNISVVRNSNLFWHKATLKDGDTVLHVSDAFETSLSYTVPRSWFTSKPSSTSFTATVSVQTYTDQSCETAVGDPAEATVTVNADAGMVPTVSAGWVTLSPYNTGAVSGITGYVKGYSKAKAEFDTTDVDMTADVGATIASFSIACQGSTDSTALSPPADLYTPVLTATSVNVICTVTDSRGRTASETFTLTVMDYTAPVLTSVSVFRCDDNGDPDESGTKYSVTAGVTIASLGSQNTLTLSCAIMAAGGSYGPETALANGVRSILGPILADLSYTVRVTATDALGNNAVFYQAIPTQKWAMKFRANGSGVAFGKAAETDSLFDVNWNARFRGNLQADGDVSVTGDANVAGDADITGDASIGGNLTVGGAITGIADAVYPVGSIYMSVNSANPGTLFGGTWVQIEDTFLLAAGQTYTAGDTGGEADHTLTIDEMPEHNHTVARGSSTGTTEWGLVRYNTQNSSADSTRIAKTGGGQPHNNMPPYLVVYVWKRTA